MKIVHPVFGELTFNNGWTKSIKLNIFKKEFSVEINIDADEDAVFDENQIKAFEFFFSDIQNCVTQAENGIVGYYNSIIDEVIDRLGSDSNFGQKLLNAKDNPSEIFKFLTVKQIMIPMNFDDNTREAGFICDCEWDIENGVGIKYINEQISEIGFQDILL